MELRGRARARARATCSCTCTCKQSVIVGQANARTMADRRRARTRAGHLCRRAAATNQSALDGPAHRRQANARTMADRRRARLTWHVHVHVHVHVHDPQAVPPARRSPDGPERHGRQANARMAGRRATNQSALAGQANTRTMADRRRARLTWHVHDPQAVPPARRSPDGPERHGRQANARTMADRRRARARARARLPWHAHQPHTGVTSWQRASRRARPCQQRAPSRPSHQQPEPWHLSHQQPELPQPQHPRPGQHPRPASRQPLPRAPRR